MSLEYEDTRRMKTRKLMGKQLRKYFMRYVSY